MKSQTMDQAYDVLLKRAIGGLVVRTAPEVSDRRMQPRFKFGSERVGVRLEYKHQVLDVSESGIAFASHIAYSSGQIINLNYLDLVRIDTRVIDCRFAESDPTFMDARYIVRCEFMATGKGLELMELLEV